jgi:hypothetical protein
LRRAQLVEHFGAAARQQPGGLVADTGDRTEDGAPCMTCSDLGLMQIAFASVGG